MRRLSDKIVTIDALRAFRHSPSNHARKWVQCDGVFDLLHLGHIESFIFAKSYAADLGPSWLPTLYVVVVGDGFVRKGAGRPLFDQDTRAKWIAAIEAVDYVVINQAEGPHLVIADVKPDFLAKGIEYATSPKEGFVKDRALVESYGGSVIFTPETMHSTDIIKRLNH